MHHASSDGARTPSKRKLEATLSRGVRTPMAALRAALEGLEFEDMGSISGTRLVSGALRQLVDLDKHLDVLLEYVAPADPRPLRCSVAEILRSARTSTEAEQRVLVASENTGSFYAIDGPLVARALTRLLDEALRESAESVLLRARADDSELRFTIVEHSCPSMKPTPCAWDDLEVHLAEREIERVGGSTSVHTGSGDHKLFEVRIPATEAAQ